MSDFSLTLQTRFTLPAPTSTSEKAAVCELVDGDDVTGVSSGVRIIIAEGLLTIDVKGGGVEITFETLPVPTKMSIEVIGSEVVAMLTIGVNFGTTGELTGEERGDSLLVTDVGTSDDTDPLTTALATATAAVAVITLGNDDEDDGTGMGTMIGIFSLVGDVT